MQRAVILMRAKDVEFEVTYVNLRDKPGWFLEISPVLGSATNLVYSVVFFIMGTIIQEGDLPVNTFLKLF